ncbi:MAG: hypothetical protein IPG34_19955 [Rhodocyclaceae bacterium]|nr:hypothetical protein [Rhodocyclaceae bacterium]
MRLDSRRKVSATLPGPGHPSRLKRSLAVEGQLILHRAAIRHRPRGLGGGGVEGEDAGAGGVDALDADVRQGSP